MTDAAGKIVNEKFTRVEKIGSGGFGWVYKYTENATGKYFAIKELEYDYDEAEITYYEMFKDVEKVHPNLVKYYDIISSPLSEYYYIVMDNIEGRNLKYWLKDNSKDISASKIIDMMRQLISGLKFLHDNGIAHNDIKAENVMVGVDGIVKIIDYGGTCYLDRMPRCEKNITGDTFIKSLPLINRIINNKSSIDSQSISILFDGDLWALGILFYKIANNGELFDNHNNLFDYSKAYDMWVNNKVVNDIYYGGTREENEIINMVIKRSLYIPDDPNELAGRPTVDEIYNMLCGGGLKEEVFSNSSFTDDKVSYIKNVDIKFGLDTFNMNIYIDENKYLDIKNNLISYLGMSERIQLYTDGILRYDDSVISESDFGGVYVIEVLEGSYIKSVDIKIGQDTLNMDIYIDRNTYMDIKTQLISYLNLSDRIQLYTGGNLRFGNSVITDSDFEGLYVIEVFSPSS